MDMPQSTPTPPEPYADFAEIEKHFAEHLPGIAAHLASLRGRRAARLKKSDKAEVERKMHGFQASAKPYLLALGAVVGQLDPEHAHYALLEGLLKTYMRAGGVPIRDDEDAFEVQIRLARKNAAVPTACWARVPCYQKARDALWAYLSHLHIRLSPSQLYEFIEEWSQSPDALKRIQFTRQLTTALRRFRRQPPQRPTDKLAIELKSEYLTASAFLEQRLRLLVALARAAEGQRQPWAYWQKQGLNNLLSMAATHAQLSHFCSVVDREVRNTMVHEDPLMDVNTGECRFHDRESAVTWSFQEFFDKTRCLTETVLALATFESLCQLAEAQAVAYHLWSRLSVRSEQA